MHILQLCKITTFGILIECIIVIIQVQKALCNAISNMIILFRQILCVQGRFIAQVLA